MEDTSSTATSTGPRRDNALLNQSLDDIIKQNRSQRRSEKKKSIPLQKGKPTQRKGPRGPRDRVSNKMMDTTPVNNNGKGVQKARGANNNNNNDNRRDRDNNRRGGKMIVRSDSGRPASFSRRPNITTSAPVIKSTPGLRQPWERLPVAPLPAEPLKISIRNELADRPARRADASMMIDTDGPVGRPGMSASAAAYEPRDSLASRDEYRIGNRFSTQGMAIDYQLPSGVSYDTRPSRRY